ncbi:MAG: DUF459 domain-containing protein [Deltaproteobacteria bacterium]|nr:DUF459 domain-containing protein [Deltaproteobacteria bacterium]
MAPVAAQGQPGIYDSPLHDLARPLAVRTRPPGFSSPKPIRKVLLTGDSMMLEGIGPPLERYFKSLGDLEVSRQGRYSTGLCRLDVFDWFAYFRELLQAQAPDLVVITLGANDTQDIVLEGRRRHLVATDGWNEIYGQRVGELVGLAAEAGAQVLWLGLPVMGREPYNARVQNINRVTMGACQAAPNCLFWDASSSLADQDGGYSSFMTLADGRHVKVRAKDSIHLTEDGGQQMLSDLLGESPFLAASALADPAPARPGPPAAGQAEADDLDLAAGEPAEAGAQPAGAVEVFVVEDDAAPREAAQLDDTGQYPFGPFVIAETFLASGPRGQTRYLAAVPKIPPASPLPAVVLLHGAEGDQNYFPQGLGADVLADLAARSGLVLVMPDGGRFGWYLDSPIKAESQVASYIMSEFLPDALARHPIDPQRLALLGISMGGHGALTLALANPGRFKAVSLMSSVIDLESHRGDGGLDRYLRLHEILGPSELAQDVWRAHSAYFLTRRNPQALSGVALRLSVGLGDRLCLAENRQYDRLLTDLGLAHEYAEESGGHDWQLWRGDFPAHLAFLARHL